jgi:hypothetical protein
MSDELQEFHRDFFDPERRSTFIGEGSIGGKAQGLVFIRDILAAGFPSEKQQSIELNIPAFTVVRTGVFDAFVEQNDLRRFGLPTVPDDVIAHEFQQASLPAEILGDLRGLVTSTHTPLAVRSSSLLEDALHQPFAGVYMTKMIPNSQPSPDERFHRLTEAIKLIYASAFFSAARDSIRAAGRSPEDEKMAVLIQEVVGSRFGERFYPHISGVARSYHFYATGRTRPEHGVASLALGLGKTIVDGGKCWTYSPAFPALSAPVAPAELREQSQSQFWAMNLGKPPEYDPIRETEYLVLADLPDAEADGTLNLLASTYDPQSDRLTPGITRTGPRVLDFSGVLRLREIPLNDVIRKLLEICQEAYHTPVEIEFAVTLNPNRFGFLQVRPMLISTEEVEVRDDEMKGERTLVASTMVLGNGTSTVIRDVVYTRPETFDPKDSPRIALELESINRTMLAEGRPYLLIGFGRWGSSDPWLGIPVNWGHISGARAVVEAIQPGRPVDLSQGSHFFHNLMGFQVFYFSIPGETDMPIRWDWLALQPAVVETEYVRHIRLVEPLQIKVDGKTRRGVIMIDKDTQHSFA